jgi:mono/diheme cytochrome c family protein
MAGAGCSQGRHSAAGFRLPESGDAARGQMAFTAIGCNGCHSVDGVQLPPSEQRMKVPVSLGGRVARDMTDGYLVTAILNPSFHLAGYPRNEMSVNGKSKMPDFAEQMTARQLIDLVAFLQSRYETVAPSRQAPAI